MLLNRPTLEWIGGKFPWRLTSSMIWTRKDDTLIVVPAGFLTDLASVPRLPFIHAWVGGLGVMAAVVHDYLYTTAAADAYPHITRLDADLEFLHAMQYFNEPNTWLQRRAMYRAVRVFGGFTYRTRKAHEIFR